MGPASVVVYGGTELGGTEFGGTECGGNYRVWLSIRLFDNPMAGLKMIGEKVLPALKH